jgi:hypothetical protein
VEASTANTIRVGDDHTPPRPVTDDGSRVAFTTPASLVPRDTNGRLDAYLWEDGQLYLLSSGTSPDDSYAFAISASGDDAFFRTRQSLVGQDGDTLIDLYTARVGGGFASQQNEPAAGCEGETCQGPLVPAPPATDAPSIGNRARGNVRPPSDCSKFAKRAAHLSTRAARLRRQAKRGRGGRQKFQLRKRASELTQQAKRQRAKAKQCRRLSQGAGR